MATLWALVENDTVSQVIKHPKEITIGGINYPKEIFNLWSENELKSIGIYSVQRASLVDQKFYYRTDPVYTYNIGTDDVTESFTDTEKTLAQVKEVQKGQIKKIFLQKINEGFEYNTDTFDIDPVAQANINSEYNAAIDTTNIPTWPSDYVWRDFENNFIPMTRQNVIDMALAARTHIRLLYTAKWDHESAIDAYSSFSDIVNHDLTLFWPQTAVEYLA